EPKMPTTRSQGQAQPTLQFPRRKSCQASLHSKTPHRTKGTHLCCWPEPSSLSEAESCSPISLAPKIWNPSTSLNSTFLPQPANPTPSQSSEAHRFQSVKQALHIAIPERLLSREAEQASIRSFLKDKVLQHTPSSLYISGVPGTGKTACLNCVLEEMKVGCGCSVSNEKADHSLQVTQSVETCYCQYLDKIPLQFWSHL
ncbi:hypothetical protein GOODEAATRI_026064, partial [Goodea atripinnis]